MRRSDLEHIIRAAADAASEKDIVIVGSQAILAQHPNAPAELVRSQEADVYPRAAPHKATQIDGALGDGSPFHQTYGFYAHGVGPETAKAPEGWEERLIPVSVAVRRNSKDRVTGWCLEAHDLVLSKCVAGRERDWEFVEVTIRHELVAPERLLERVPDLPVDAKGRERVASMIGGLVRKLARAAKA